MQTYETQAIRNVVLVGHNGDGKTTLAEMLLFKTGAITRLGRVEDGTTASDYEPEEEKRGGSINVSVLPVRWRDCKINLLDTPGYLDFIGEALSAVRVADAALVTVDASAGPHVGTDLMWRRLDAVGLARMVFIGKMDRENADFTEALTAVQSRFGKTCVALHCPIGAHKDFRGVVDILSRTAYLADGKTSEVPAEMANQVETLRDQLVETVAETDDELATKYLEGQEISVEEIGQALANAVRTGKLHPVLAGAGASGHGIEALLDALVTYAPSPADVPPVMAQGLNGDPVAVTADPSGPLVVFVFKTTADPFVGKLSYFRVYSGALSGNTHPFNANKGQPERVAQLVVPMGKQHENVDSLAAGDIGAVAKLTVTGTGDTLTTQDAGVVLPGITFPEPIYSVSIQPKTKADLDKMGNALHRILEEDPCLQMGREGDTHEVILSGMGDSHIDVAVQKLHRKFGVDVAVGTPKVPYKETVRSSARAEYKHKKQTGGHGQYGHVVLEIAPLTRGAGFEFGDRVVGGAVPKNFIPAVEKGIREVLPEGAIAHYPIVDIKATLVDGSFHSVDSSEMSFKVAAAMALKKGVQDAQPVLLEPVMALEVVCPDEFTGDVIGQLNTKRARVHGMNTEGGLTTVQADAPLAELLRYATELRSLTQGRGSYHMQFARYEEVPGHLAQRIIEESAKTRGDGLTAATQA